MYAASGQGAWYEPSLTNSTSFQDGAGATPVTALEQLVGLTLDKSGGGKSAVQATAGLKPRLSMRANLLTKTEDFGDSAWSKDPGVTPTSNYGVAPNGTLTSTRLQFSAARMLVGQIPYTAGLVCSSQIWIKGVNGGTIQVSTGGVDTLHVLTGVWQLAQATKTAINTSFNINTYGGSTARDVEVWHPQAEPGPVTTRYQRVNTAGDFDTAGFPVKLVFDGVDDVHVTTFASALGSNCAIVRSVPGVGTTILTGQTVGTTYTNTVTHSGLIVIDRPLTASETALVTRWGNQRAGV
jgi:hypothetical protein